MYTDYKVQTGDMHSVARSWLLGNAAKSHNGNFRSTGHELWYYNMVIGRTLEFNGKKQLLDVTGVNRYSAKTSQAIGHVWSAYFELKREGREVELLTIQPDTVGEYGDFNGWRHFQKYNSTIECRATKQVWKTEKGAQNAMNKHGWNYVIKFFNAPSWSDWKSGYTFYYQQSTDVHGQVIK